MRTKTPRWAQFEKRVRDFLKDLKFDDVKGGHNFLINGIQVDAVGGHERSLLIIECTTKRKLRKKIGEFRGNTRILDEGFRSHPRYKKYKKHHFLIATNRKEIRPEDREFSGLEPTKDPSLGWKAAGLL